SRDAAMIIVVIGVFNKLGAGYFPSDFRIRKNRLPSFRSSSEISLRLVGFALSLGELIETLGLLHGLPGFRLALGLERLEVGHVLFDGAVDALLVNGEQMEIMGVLKPGSGVSEGVIDGVDTGSVIRVLGQAEGKSASFNSAGALQTPAVVGDGLDDIALEVADGGEAFEDGFTVLFVGELFFGSEDAEL